MSEERNLEKHNLTQEELDFLIELQHELNTQDTVCQADPRFWVVAGTQKTCVGKEYSEGEELCGGESVLADGIEEAVKYFQEEVIPEANEDSEEFEYILEEESTRSFKSYRLLKIDKTCNKNDEDYTEGDEILEEYNYINEIEELIEALSDCGITYDDEYIVGYYRNEYHIYPDTMFLTNRSCKRHIELNHYHYDANVHSYAMTAWRSPEVEQLWNILQKVDWLKMREEVYGKRDADSTETGSGSSK